MSSLESFKVDLKAIGDQPLALSLHAGDAFFEAIGTTEPRKGSVDVALAVSKVKGGYYELSFSLDGEVTVKCDRCLGDMSQPISGSGSIMARLGEGYSDDGDLVTVDADDGIIDTAWLVYEFIALGIPIKHVHAPGGCDAAMVEALNAHSASPADDGGQAIDPRWSGLEKLKNQ